MKSFEDIKSNIFHVNKDIFMKETKPIKLKKRSDKTVFLDTVVFGIVFKKPQTLTNLNNLNKRSEKTCTKLGAKKILMYVLLNIQNFNLKVIRIFLNFNKWLKNKQKIMVSILGISENTFISK